MEPISTLALVAAFLAPAPLTKRPDWNEVPSVIHLRSDPTDVLVISPVVAETEAVVKHVQTAALDKSDFLLREVATYGALKDGWDGEGSKAVSAQSMQAAVNFVKTLPGGLPLPGAMVSGEGEVGFYWDLPQGFAEIRFDEAGSGTFFSYHKGGLEAYIQDLKAEVFTRSWFFESLGGLASPHQKAA
jgi:hypothetical protein